MNKLISDRVLFVSIAVPQSDCSRTRRSEPVCSSRIERCRFSNPITFGHRLACKYANFLIFDVVDLFLIFVSFPKGARRVAVDEPDTAALPTAGGSNDPTLGEQSTDTDKVGFDPASDTWVVCTGAWTPTPPIAVVKTAGSACNPRTEQFMAISDDAYLISCSQVNGSSVSAWVRPH
jgi:hypothetical protein